MRLALFAVLAFPAFLSASVMDGANERLEKSRAEYAALCGKASAELDALALEIGRLKSETDSLEAGLASLRDESAALDGAAKSLAPKDAKFQSLRKDAEAFRDFLASKGFQSEILISNDMGLFAKDFESLCSLASSAVNPSDIIGKIAVKDSGTAVKNFKEGRAQVLEIDPSLGGLARSRSQSLAEHFRSGGIWMYPILAFGFAAFAVGCAKFAVSFKAKRAPKGIVKRISALLDAGNADGALALAQKAPYPYGGMLASFVENRHLEKPLLEEMSYEHMLDAGERLYSGLGFISVTAAVSPLLGLLGTVTGIIKTFGDLSLYGAGNSQLMSAGISEALITTEFGLVVAIPAIVVHALLTRRAKAVLSDMEKLAAAFLSYSSK